MLVNRFLPLKIQIIYKKPGFGRKNQLRMGSHLGQQHSPHKSIYEGRKVVGFVLWL
jgi:hypothetical protein